MPATKKTGRRSRFTPEQRRQLVERATLRLADGVSYSESAKQIGVCYETFRRWRMESSGSPRLRPVRARPAAPEAPAATRALVLVTVSGHRVEGLELGQVVELVRALG
jgi:transposase-like protein